MQSSIIPSLKRSNGAVLLKRGEIKKQTEFLTSGLLFVFGKFRYKGVKDFIVCSKAELGRQALDH